jgi:hypothetical protein
MAVTVADSGSQTATISTEHTLSTITTAGVYTLAVDSAALAAGDSVVLRVYGKARSADTERLIFESAFSDVQGDPLKLSFTVVSPHHFKATLQQTAGTGRAFPWAVYAA